MFWEQLRLIGQIYFVLGCVASVLLLIQFILLLIGFSGDGDIDIGGDGGADFDGDADGGIGIFTLKGIIGFFAIGGWVGVACVVGGLHDGWTIAVSIICGFVAFIAIGLAFKAIRKLQASGTIDNRNAIGKVAEVYLKVPAKGEGHGKLSIVIQGKLVEMDAITDELEAIPTGREVKVIGLIGDVCRVSSDLNVEVEVPIIENTGKKGRKRKQTAEE
ncbi:MAG: hypothetical protein K2P12_05570 [Clostridia bacterium]|nr:hypothetical protein [Clostridia bacterium]